MPDLGRWMNLDPLAEAVPNWTPYRYGFNNPMRFVDPTGMLETNYEDEFGNSLARTNDGNDATVVVSNENVESFLEDFESTHFMQRDGHSANAEWISEYGAGMIAEEGTQIQPWAIEALGYSNISEGLKILNTGVGLGLSGYGVYNVSNGKFRGASGNYYTFKNRKGWNQHTGTKARMNNTLSKAKWASRGATALGVVNYGSIINQRQEIGNTAFGIEMISNTISTFTVPAVSIPWTIGYEGLGRNGIARIPWYQNTFKPWARQKIGVND